MYGNGKNNTSVGVNLLATFSANVFLTISCNVIDDQTFSSWALPDNLMMIKGEMIYLWKAELQNKFLIGYYV